jgi:hypothetical protein
MSVSHFNLMSPVAASAPAPREVAVAERARGRRLGFLSNRKPNSADVEREVARLAEGAGLADSVRFYEKASPGEGASPALMDQIAEECDAVMVGSADCGSCTAWSCADAVALESRGLLSIVLCTSAFVPLAESQSQALGRPGLARFEVPHPLGGSNADVAVAKAQVAWPQMEEWLNRVLPATATA